MSVLIAVLYFKISVFRGIVLYFKISVFGGIVLYFKISVFRGIVLYFKISVFGGFSPLAFRFSRVLVTGSFCWNPSSSSWDQTENQWLLQGIDFGTPGTQSDLLLPTPLVTASVWTHCSTLFLSTRKVPPLPQRTSGSNVEDWTDSGAFSFDHEAELLWTTLPVQTSTSM